MSEPEFLIALIAALALLLLWAMATILDATPRPPSADDATVRDLAEALHGAGVGCNPLSGAYPDGARRHAAIHAEDAAAILAALRAAA